MIKKATVVVGWITWGLNNVQLLLRGCSIFSIILSVSGYEGHMSISIFDRIVVYLKSISSTFIELISFINKLNFTTTGIPFFDGGRTSISAIHTIEINK